MAPQKGVVMDFSLAEEQKMIQQTVRRFVERELMPLENEVLQSEGKFSTGIEPTVFHSLRMKAKEMGFWGINTPEEYGGANLGAVMTALIAMELGRTLVPFSFGGAADNILYLGNEQQKKEYLIPTIEGTRHSCFALTEPGAGSDPSAIRTTAVKDGSHWVINGQKVFITGGNEADFAMVFAVTDRNKPPQNGGVTCFLVDREMGWTSRPVPTMGGWSPAELFFENVRVPEDHILGEVGQGFSLTNFAQHMIFRYAHIIKEEFGRRPTTHSGNGARGPAHRAINKEAGDSAVLWWFIAVGNGEDHGE